MTNWTIRWRIVVSFAVILALMTLMATVAYTRLARIDELTAIIDKDVLPGLIYSNEIKIDRIANYSLTAEYALQADPAVKQKLQAAILASREDTKTLLAEYSQHVNVAGERELFESFKAAEAAYESAQDDVLAAGLALRRGGAHRLQRKGRMHGAAPGAEILRGEVFAADLPEVCVDVA